VTAKLASLQSLLSLTTSEAAAAAVAGQTSVDHAPACLADSAAYLHDTRADHPLSASSAPASQ